MISFNSFSIALKIESDIKSSSVFSEDFSLNEFKKSMNGIYSSSVVRETIDESPMTYKDSDMIKKALDRTITIVKQLKPVLNVKALT